MARVKKMKAKGSVVDLQKGLGNIFNSIESMKIDDRNIDNSCILLEKFQEYNDVTAEMISQLMRLDQRLSASKIMVPKLPELNKQLIVDLRMLRFDLSPYVSCIDLMSMPVDDLVLMKNAFINIQSSSMIDTLLKIYRNITLSKISKLNYLQYIRSSATDKISMYLTADVPIEELPAYAKRAKSSRVMDNLCEIWSMSDFSNELSSTAKEDIYVNLVDLTKLGKRLYENRKKPDIDIDQLFTSLTKYISSMKKEVHGCESAFKCIEKSSHLFKQNYKQYYKEIIKSGNPMAIIESFTCDVIKDNAGASLRELSELRKLSRHIKKLISKQTMGRIPPEMKKMMDELDDCFDSILDKKSDGADIDSDKANKEFEELLS
jgi:hypothetical protein